MLNDHSVGEHICRLALASLSLCRQPVFFLRAIALRHELGWAQNARGCAGALQREQQAGCGHHPLAAHAALPRSTGKGRVCLPCRGCGVARNLHCLYVNRHRKPKRLGLNKVAAPSGKAMCGQQRPAYHHSPASSENSSALRRRQAYAECSDVSRR